MEVAQLLSWGKAGAIFVVVLGILVFSHELGHFLIARLSNDNDKANNKQVCSRCNEF